MTIKSDAVNKLLQFLDTDDWEIDYGNSDVELVIRHVPTGNEYAFKEDGTLDAPAVSTEQLTSDYHFAGAYDGADPDARLDNAISAAVDGDTIYLENGTYDSDRTISKKLEIIGVGSLERRSGTDITGAWTLSAEVDLLNLGIRENATTDAVTVTTQRCTLIRIGLGNNATVRVQANEVAVESSFRGEVIFETGNSGGLVDSCRGTAVTDNDGGNTQGDIA